MKGKISIAVAALLSIISPAEAIQMSEQNKIETEISESNRYIGSDGKPINLAQQGTARLELTRINKEPRPIGDSGVTLLMTEVETETGCAVDSDAQKKTLQKAGVQLDEITHCPINGDGNPVKAHIFQNNLSDNAYVSDFYVGNPPQKVRGLFDTGSTNTWILNDSVKLAGGAVKEYSFKEQESTTFHETDQRAFIQFGSGALSGQFVVDDVRLGTCDGQSSGQVHIAQQKFGNVLRQKTIFNGDNFEAIVGMAYPALAEKGVTPVFDEMMNQKLLASNMFAFYLTTKEEEEDMGHKSDLTLGYYDASKFTGNVDWHDIKLKYMFGVQLDDIKVNGKALNICDTIDNACLITFDSGTSLGSVPPKAAEAMIAAGIPTADHMVECVNREEIGELTYIIGGNEYTLSPEEWLFPEVNINLAQGGSKIEHRMGPVGPQLFMQLEGPAPESNAVMVEADEAKKHHASAEVNDSMKQACTSSIMQMGIKDEMFLVGDIFMRKFYTIFDRDNDRVGLALAKHDGASLAQKASSDDADDFVQVEKKDEKKEEKK